MTKQTLTQNELDAMAAAMEAADFGEEIEIEIVEDDEHGDHRFESDEYEGQPSAYEEYQDLYGGDDWDQGQFDDDVDF